jgi:hypothetical protein
MSIDGRRRQARSFIGRRSSRTMEDGERVEWGDGMLQVDRSDVFRVKLRGQSRDDGYPAAFAILHVDWGSASGRWCWRGVLEDNISPALKDRLGDVQLPVDGAEEGHLVHVDLERTQAGDLAPCSSGVVAILEVLRRKDESGQKHAATALQREGSGSLMR